MVSLAQPFREEIKKTIGVYLHSALPGETVRRTMVGHIVCWLLATVTTEVEPLTVASQLATATPGARQQSTGSAGHCKHRWKERVQDLIRTGPCCSVRGSVYSISFLVGATLVYLHMRQLVNCIVCIPTLLNEHCIPLVGREYIDVPYVWSIALSNSSDSGHWSGYEEE